MAWEWADNRCLLDIGRDALCLFDLETIVNFEK